MIDNKVTFEMVFPIEPYRNFKLGYEGSIEPNETYTEAAMKAFDKVMAAGDKVYAALRLPILSATPTSPLSEIAAEKPIPQDQRIRSLIDDVCSCTDLKILESYRLLAKRSPELQQAYDEMLKKLTP